MQLLSSHDKLPQNLPVVEKNTTNYFILLWKFGGQEFGKHWVQHSSGSLSAVGRCWLGLQFSTLPHSYRLWSSAWQCDKNWRNLKWLFVVWPRYSLKDCLGLKNPIYQSKLRNGFIVLAAISLSLTERLGAAEQHCLPFNLIRKC